MIDAQISMMIMMMITTTMMIGLLEWGWWSVVLLLVLSQLLARLVESRIWVFIWILNIAYFGLIIILKIAFFGKPYMIRYLGPSIRPQKERSAKKKRRKKSDLLPNHQDHIWCKLNENSDSRYIQPNGAVCFAQGIGRYASVNSHVWLLSRLCLLCVGQRWHKNILL